MLKGRIKVHQEADFPVVTTPTPSRIFHYDGDDGYDYDLTHWRYGRNQVTQKDYWDRLNKLKENIELAQQRGFTLGTTVRTTSTSIGTIIELSCDPFSTYNFATKDFDFIIVDFKSSDRTWTNAYDLTDLTIVKEEVQNGTC